MSAGPRPPRDPGGRAAAGRPKGYSEEAVLSEEEVQRRVNVEGGGQLQPRPPEHKFRDRRANAASGRRRAGGAGRDALLLIGLVIVGLVAVGVLLPDGPLTASASHAPSAPATSVAVATLGPAVTPAVTPAPTAGLVTLPPAATGGATASPGMPTPVVTPPPATRPPGSSPQPTPKVTPSPTKTPAPSTPATARLVVAISVINGDGGTSPASAWTVTVTSAGTATPSTFAGSASGTNVTISAGASYSVVTSGPSGYATSASADCSSAAGGLPPAGSTQTCTILKNDIAPRVTVTTIVDGGTATASDWTVSVSATDPNPASFAGSAAGVTVRFDAGAPYSITSESPSGTDYTLQSSSGCDGPSLALGASATCTFTYTYEPPPTEAPAPPAALVPLAPRAWHWLSRVPRGRTRWARTPRA